MERWGETLLGAAVVAVAGFFFFFAAAQAGQSGGERSGGYDLFARFQRADGIAIGSDIRMSGVKIGVVRSISIDPDTFFAKVELWIDRGVEACARFEAGARAAPEVESESEDVAANLDEFEDPYAEAPAEQSAQGECVRWRTEPVTVLDDSTARIASDGLLGGAYVAIEPAGLDPLAPGGEIFNTQGSVDLLTLMSSAVQGMGASSETEAEESLQ